MLATFDICGGAIFIVLVSNVKYFESYVLCLCEHVCCSSAMLILFVSVVFFFFCCEANQKHM
jgi:hypothetical protein